METFLKQLTTLSFVVVEKQKGLSVMAHIKISKSWTGSYHISLFDKIDIVIGVKDGFGIGFDLNWYDRAITFDLIKVFIIIEKYWSLDSLYLAVDGSDPKDEE